MTGKNKIGSINKIFKFLNRYSSDILLIFLLAYLTYNVWNLLSQLTIRSDGFLYMLEKSHEWFFNTPFFFTGFENSAMVFGYIFSKIYGVNLSFYYWTVLAFLMAIDVLLYITMKFITKRSSIAFVSSLFFAANYFGIYDMVSTHCYCFFLERVIPVILLIPSFLFLHLFLEKKVKKFYIISSIFYFFGVGLGHFTVLFTPFFLFYPIFWYFFNEKMFKKKVQGIIYGLSYLSQSAFFVLIQQINESGLGPKKWTFTEFLFNPEKYLYIKKIALQFVYWTQHPIILKEYGVSLESIIDVRRAESLIPFILSAYLIAGLIIYMRLPKQRPMLLTTILGTTVIFYLNAYFNQYDMLNFSGASRYLYFPSFLLAIFWSYFLWAVFFQKKNLLVVGGISLIAMYYFTNFFLIKDNFRHELRWNKSTRAVFDHIIATRNALGKNTLVITPYPEFGSQESTFFTEQLGKGEVRYMSEHNPDDVDTWEKRASISAHVIKIKYGRDCSCIVEEKLK